jgi:tRNA(Ile)-lysidine synthase
MVGISSGHGGAAPAKSEKRTGKSDNNPVREKVLQFIREQKLMRAGDRVGVAVSGGADSVALLRVLLELRQELGVVLAVAHFNHGLRGAESDGDQAFVAELARQSGLEFFAGVADVRDHAVLNKLSVEAAGRELRYAWFARLAAAKRLDAIATAHTLDDQAETVLLKFLRGAGTKGLAGIYPVVRSEPSDEAPGARALFKETAAGATETALLHRGSARIVRPLLGATRDEVEAYLESLGQSWREDTSNLDHRFLRNRVRHELLPVLEREYNPNIRQALSDVAEIARGEEEYWQNEVEGELARRTLRPGLKPQERPRAETGLKAGASTERHLSDGGLPEKASPSTRRRLFEEQAGLGRDDNIRGEHADAVLKARSSTAADTNASAASSRLLIEDFARLPIALQRRVLKSFAERNGITLDFEHVEKLRRCALGELARTELPGSILAVNVKQWLELRSCSQADATEYEVVLPIPGEVQIDELGLTLRATIVPQQFGREVQPGELLSRDLVGTELAIRNWRPGDRFWPAHSGSEEKLKRLFAEKKIPADERTTWPVALNEDEIVWVRGFPVAKTYCWSGKGEGVRIEAVPTEE